MLNTRTSQLLLRVVFVVFGVLCATAAAAVLLDTLKFNLYARSVLSHALGSDLPWTNTEWWTTACREKATASHEASLDGGSGILVAEAQSHSPTMATISEVMRGDCEAAITTLDRFADGSLRNLLLAHLYVRTAQWDKIPDLVPLESVTRLDSQDRRFWTNAYYRLAFLSPLSAQDQLTWARRVDELSGGLPLDGSVQLAQYLSSSGRPIEAFYELGRALVYEQEPSAARLYPLYAKLRDAALAAKQSSAAYGKAPYRDTDKNWAVAPDYAIYTTKRIVPSQPEYVLEGPIVQGWQLIGLDVNEDDLRLGPFVRTHFYWCRNVESECTEYASVSAMEHNLIGNAAFELDPEGPNIKPFGFVGGYYGETPPYPYDIVSDSNDKALCLTADGGRTSAGVMTPWQKVESDDQRQLVVGGRIRTEAGGKAYMGMHWRLDGDVRVEHVVPGAMSSEWSKKAALVYLPQEASERTFHLLKFQSQGKACFDDLFAFTVPRPPSVEVSK